MLTETLEPANAYVSRVEVTCDNFGTASYDFDTKTLTLPSNTTGASVQYSVTLTYYTVNDSGAEISVSASLSDLTVYPDTWVVRDGNLYKDVKRYTDFSSDTDVEYANDGNGAISGTSSGAKIVVGTLAEENNTSNASITFKNVKDSSTSSTPILMELKVLYSDTTNICAILALPGQNTRPWFWLLRNTFGGTAGKGTAFRVGNYAKAEGAKYTVPENEPFTLGYLFDGADNTESNADTTVKFFFNGENKFVPLTTESLPKVSDVQSIYAPTLGTDVTLQLWKESPEANGNDSATMTIQEAVFYELAEAASVAG